MTAMPLSPSKKEGGNQTHHSSPKKTLSKPPRHPMLVESGSPPGPPPVTTASSHKHHAVQDSLASLEELFLSKEDRAEQGLLKSMEQRRSFVSESNTKEWRPATPGERPPLVGTTMEPSTTLLAMESGVAHARRASELSQVGFGGIVATCCFCCTFSRFEYCSNSWKLHASRGVRRRP